MTPEEQMAGATAPFIAGTLSSSGRAALNAKLMLLAQQFAEMGVPGDTVDGWLEEAREAYRRRTIEMSNARDQVR